MPDMGAFLFCPGILHAAVRWLFEDGSETVSCGLKVFCSVIIKYFTHGSFSIGYPDGESIITFASFAPLRFSFCFSTARFAQDARDAKSCLLITNNENFLLKDFSLRSLRL